MAIFNVDKALAAGKTPDQIKAFLQAHPDVQPSKPLNAPQQPPQTMGQAVGTLAGQAANAALPAPAQAVQAGMQAPPNVQEGLIRGGATEVGQLTGGPVGAGVGAMAGSTAVDLINSPSARQAIGQGAQGMATGNPQAAVISPIKAAMANPDAVINSLKNSGEQGAGAAATSALLSGAMSTLKGEGPFSAVFQQPKLASGSVRQVLKQTSGNAELALHQADKAAGLVTTGELNRITEMVAARGQKLVKVANEAAGIIENGAAGATPTSKLLLYEDALGKASKAVGGGVATRYQGAVQAIREELVKRAPELDGFLAKRAGAASAYAAEGMGPGDGSNGGLIDAVRNIPSATTSLINSTLGNPALGRTAGLVGRLGMEAAVPSSAALMEALKRLQASRGGK